MGFLPPKSLKMIENGKKVFFPIFQIRADFKGINFNMLRIRLAQNEIAVRKLHLLKKMNLVPLAYNGHMSRTGPKKCFIPQNCEKYTNFQCFD